MKKKSSEVELFKGKVGSECRGGIGLSAQMEVPERTTHREAMRSAEQTQVVCEQASSPVLYLRGGAMMPPAAGVGWAIRDEFHTERTNAEEGWGHYSLWLRVHRSST